MLALALRFFSFFFALFSFLFFPGGTNVLLGRRPTRPRARRESQGALSLSLPAGEIAEREARAWGDENQNDAAAATSLVVVGPGRVSCLGLVLLLFASLLSSFSAPPALPAEPTRRGAPRSRTKRARCDAQGEFTTFLMAAIVVVQSNFFFSWLSAFLTRKKPSRLLCNRKNRLSRNSSSPRTLRDREGTRCSSPWITQ